MIAITKDKKGRNFMNKKFLVVLAGLTALSLSACDKGNDNTSSSNSSPISNSSSSSSSQSSSFTEEELAQGRAYLEENGKSVCKVEDTGAGFTQYCTNGEEISFTINHVLRNVKANLGDVSIMQYDSASYISEAIPVSSSDTFPSNEVETVYRDWKLNHCAVDGSGEECSQDIHVDDANAWNWRIMVGTDGKIEAIYPAGASHSSPAEPYFSNYEYTSLNNDNMYFSLSRDFGMESTGDTTFDERGLDTYHLQTWAIADPGEDRYSTGFNILEHSDHSNGRFPSYWFQGANEGGDLLTWAFMGPVNTVDTSWGFTHHTQVREVQGSDASLVDNTEEVYSLMKVPYAVELTKFFIPGQFDSVRFTYERTGGTIGEIHNEYRLTETFEYDPYGIYLKFKAYADYLVDLYDAADGQTSVDADIYYSNLTQLETNALNLMYGLNSDAVRASDQRVLEVTEQVQTSLELYKSNIINLANELR